MSDRSDRWHLVGPWIKARYTSLGKSQAEVVREAEISDTTLRRMEKGAPGRAPRSATLVRLDRALEWPPGTIGRLLDGDLDEPPDPPAADGEASDAERLERLEQKVDQLSELLIAALSGDIRRPFEDGARAKQVLGGLPEGFDPDEEGGDAEATRP